MSYILITAAKNEERYIEETILTILSQEFKPKEWIIVNDNSEDHTENIILKYAKDNNFIKLAKRSDQGTRDFASKVLAIRMGLKQVTDLEYDYIGNLDADMKFNKDYYKNMIKQFKTYSNLGIVGGEIYDLTRGRFKKQKKSKYSVAGNIQFFKRDCWEDIGGYPVLKLGWEDGVAEVTARMKGWQVRSIKDNPVYHLRATGTEGKNIWQIKWKEGKIEYYIGYHPLFHMARGLQRFIDSPIFLGSIVRSMSYLLYSIKGDQRPVSDEFVAFQRKEEMEKIRNVLLGMINGKIEY